MRLPYFEPFYLQIITKRYWVYKELLSDIFKHISSSGYRNSNPRWEVISFKDPEDIFKKKVKEYIKFIHPLYKNMGYLYLEASPNPIDTPCLKIRFIQSRYGVRSSQSCIVYIFNEFCNYLHKYHEDRIGTISILNFSPCSINKPCCEFPYVYMFISRVVNPKDFIKVISDDPEIQDLVSLCLRYEGSAVKNAVHKIAMIPAIDNIMFQFFPSSQFFKRKSEIVRILILRFFLYLQNKYWRSSEGISIFNL